MTEATKHVPTFVTVKVTEGAKVSYGDFYLNTVPPTNKDGAANADAGRPYFLPVGAEVKGEDDKYAPVLGAEGKAVPAHPLRLYIAEFKEENGGKPTGTLRVVRENTEVPKGQEGRFTEIGSGFPDQKWPKFTADNQKDGEAKMAIQIAGKVRKDKDTDKMMDIGDHAPFKALVDELRVTFAATSAAAKERKAEATNAAGPKP